MGLLSTNVVQDSGIHNWITMTILGRFYFVLIPGENNRQILLHFFMGVSELSWNRGNGIPNHRYQTSPATINHMNNKKQQLMDISNYNTKHLSKFKNSKYKTRAHKSFVFIHVLRNARYLFYNHHERTTNTYWYLSLYNCKCKLSEKKRK